MSNPTNEQPRLVICRCQHCDGHIEFDASQAGESVTCPHCNAETTLYVPPISEQEANLSPVPPSADEIKQAELEQFKVEKILQIKKMMRARLDNGKPAILYDSIFVPVDSILDEQPLADEFDLSKLRCLGLIGWDVVQAVPKTIGIGLKNVGTDTLFAEKWGGGIGGNVLGVHLIIKKSLSASDLTDDPADEVGKFIRHHLSDFLPD